MRRIKLQGLKEEKEKTIPISEIEIIAAADEYLRTHVTIEPRDIYYSLGLKWGYQYGHERPVPLSHISRVLKKNGFVCVENRAHGRSKYQKK